MKEPTSPAPEHQVSEQEMIASFWGSLIHPDVEIRRIDPQTLLLMNTITGATLTLTAEAVQPEHTHFVSRKYVFTEPACPGCNWEGIDPPPVKLSVLKGNRP